MNEPGFIMLVDDNEATNYFHTLVIKESGINTRVLSFTYVRKALDFLLNGTGFSDNNAPQHGIIFLDINMPGMNGWDFLEEFEKFPEKLKKQIDLVILTTSENPFDRRKANENPNIKSYKIKPLTSEMLIEIIDSFSNQYP